MATAASYPRRNSRRSDEMDRTMERIHDVNSWTPSHAARASQILQDMKQRHTEDSATLHRHLRNDDDSWTPEKSLLSSDSTGSRQSLAERAQAILEDLRRKRQSYLPAADYDAGISSAFSPVYRRPYSGTTKRTENSQYYISDTNEEEPEMMSTSGSDSSPGDQHSDASSSGVLPLETRKQAIAKGMVDVSRTLVPRELSQHSRTTSHHTKPVTIDSSHHHPVGSRTSSARSLYRDDTVRLSTHLEKHSSSKTTKSSSDRDLFYDNVVRLSTHLAKHNRTGQDQVPPTVEKGSNDRSTGSGFSSSHSERRSVLTKMLDSISELKEEALAANRSKHSSRLASSSRAGRYHSRAQKILEAREKYRNNPVSPATESPVTRAREDDSKAHICSTSVRDEPQSIRELYGRPEHRQSSMLPPKPDSARRVITPDAKTEDKLKREIEKHAIRAPSPGISLLDLACHSRSSGLFYPSDESASVSTAGTWAADLARSSHKGSNERDTSGFFLLNEKLPSDAEEKATPGWSFTEFEWTSFDDQSVVSIWGTNPGRDTVYTTDPLDDLSMAGHSPNKLETIEESGTLTADDCAALNLEERFAGGTYYIYYQTMDPDIVHEPVTKRKLRRFNRKHPYPVEHCSGGLYLIAVRTAMSEI